MLLHRFRASHSSCSHVTPIRSSEFALSPSACPPMKSGLGEADLERAASIPPFIGDGARSPVACYNIRSRPCSDTSTRTRTLTLDQVTSSIATLIDTHLLVGESLKLSLTSLKMEKPTVKDLYANDESQRVEISLAQSDSISPSQSREERRLLWKQDVALVVTLSGCFFFAYLV